VVLQQRSVPERTSCCATSGHHNRLSVVCKRVLVRVSNAVLSCTVVLLVSACHSEQSKTCSNNKSQICSIPFELLYVNRKSFANRDIELEGVLVAGQRSEPPGSNTPVILLFSSAERAQICNPEFAVNIVPRSEKIRLALNAASGNFVSVHGLLSTGTTTYWADMKVTAPAVSLGRPTNDFKSCMELPPPMPPEPSNGPP
jgi:hypothetical protein